MALYIADYQTHRNKYHFKQKHDVVKKFTQLFF